MSISAALSIARRYRSGGRVETNPPMRIKKHINFQGLQISIETPKGEIRRGIDHEGKPWANRMAVDYGYIRRTEGKDGDQVDVFVGPNRRSDKVFVIDQLHHHMEKFDEHKCLVGFNDKKQALTAYHASYGRKYGAHHTVGAVTELSIDAFKEWLKGGGGKKPVSPEVPQYQDGGSVGEFEAPAWAPRPLKRQAGGAIEPFDEFQMQREAALVKPPTPEEPQYPMEPSLQEAQMGQQELPEGTAVNEAGEIYRKDTGEVIPQTRRPGFLPVTKTPAGHYEAAMPKILDIAGNMGAGWSVPVRGAEAILGAGLAIPKAAKGVGKTAWDLHPGEVASALQISGTKGTSAGGIFSGFIDGIDRYVKVAKSLEHAKEEVLASKLYELAGVRAAKTELTELNGKPAVASQIIPDVEQLSVYPPSGYSYIGGLSEDFPAHAWLANWDAPGVGSENPLGNILVDNNLNAHYVDFGGALRFRGLGGQKGDLFGPKVTETKTMLGDTAKNPLVASVFGGHQISPDNPVAQKIANISSKQIHDLLDVYGPTNLPERAKMFNTLISRRNDIAKQYGLEVAQYKPQPPTPKGGTPTSDFEKLQAEWEAKLAETPTEYAPKYSELSGYTKPKLEYTLKHSQEDADRLLHNNSSTEHGEESYDAHGVASDMYNMALENPDHVDAVYKHLPTDLQEEVTPILNNYIKINGDPWGSMEVATPKAPPAGEGGTGIGGTIKLMNLNKTHNAKQVVDSIKDYHISELTAGKTITEKQIGKIKKMLTEDFTSNNIYQAIKKLDPDDQKNVLSWLPAAKASHIKTIFKIDPEKAAQPIPDIDKISKSHSLYQVLGAIKNYSPQYAEVPYHATQSIPKEISKFSPSEIMKEMEPLSLAQKQKVMEWLPESTKEKMAQIGAEKAAKKMGFIGQEYYDALEPLNWSTYKPKQAESAKHHFSKTMLQHLTSLGFNPDVTLYKGGKHQTYPQTILDPVTEPHRLANPDERAFFMSHDPEVAKAYGIGAAQAPMEYVARPEKVFAVDWKDATGTEDYSSHHMKRFIEAAREKGADLLVVKNVADIGGYGHGLQTQYAFLNTHVLRAPSAKFDPAKLHLRYPLAGLVGGGLFSYGMLKDQEREGEMARGGGVKSTKETANYRLGTKAEHCAICTMFREPDSCTAVQGKIRRQDTCDYFEKIKGMARGGQTRTYTMPLKPGSSEKVKSQNISEFHTGPTYAHTKAKFGKARADRQAIAVALSNARKYGKKKAFGGPNIESMIMRGSSYKLGREGMINSSIPGRTDKLPMNVKAGSYVLPADIPSALGQGNTMAGGEILKKMFSSGPYGMAAPRGGRGTLPRPLSLRTPTPKMRANGGEAGDANDSHVPIIAAGGEYIIHPEVVRDIGHGDIKAGHKVLDKFVLNVRKKNIETLKKLPGPKR